MIGTDLLLRLLRYDPETGKLFWRPRERRFFASDKSCKTWNTRFAGKEAITANNGEGYRVGFVLGQKVKAHRIIWKMCRGTEPLEIDHINGNPADNRLENLREVDRAGQCQNRRLAITNKSGWPGVRMTKCGNFGAVICHRGKREWLGTFGTLEDAVAAKQAAERRLGFHENHGLARGAETRHKE